MRKGAIERLSDSGNDGYTQKLGKIHEGWDGVSVASKAGGNYKRIFGMEKG